MALITAGFLLAAPAAHAAANEKTETTTTHHATKRVESAKRVDSRDKTVVDPATAPDNTGVNKRDRADSEATADQQKNDKTDLALTAEIRRAIIKDKTLSTNAHNVKIIAQNGNVTLKGPVASKTERVTVEKVALDAMGPGKGTITNEISVAP